MDTKSHQEDKCVECDELLSESIHCKHIPPSYCGHCAVTNPSHIYTQDFHCIRCNMEDEEFYNRGTMFSYKFDVMDMITIYDLGFHDGLTNKSNQGNNHIFGGSSNYPGGIIYVRGYCAGLNKKKIHNV